MTNDQHKPFSDLLKGFLDHSLNEDELLLFLELLQVPDNLSIAQDQLDQDLEAGTFEGLTRRGQLEEAYKALQGKMHPAINEHNSRNTHIWSGRWWMAAAAVAIITGTTLLLFVHTRPTDKTTVTVSISSLKNDVSPGSARPQLTLANGTTIGLDSAKNGLLARQGTAHIVKKADGRIAYEANGDKDIQYNTLTVPRGCKVAQLQLSDGSEAFLNAGSSITFPTAFKGKTREITMTGEAYFEIANKSGAPFIVKKGEMNIQVLGTHFDVSAYDDEEAMKVTLLEGAVKVSKGAEGVLLKPGQQAKLPREDAAFAFKVFNDVDTTEVMAWKNGRFELNGTTLKEIMRQIARWYDVEVIYEGKVGDPHFTGGISRDVPVSQVFDMLEATEAIYFRIEGRKVTVTPVKEHK
jgi:transmembrane sensor